MKAKKTKHIKRDSAYFKLLRKDSLFATLFVFIFIYLFSFLLELNFSAFTIIDNSYKDIDFTDILYSRPKQDSSTLQQLATRDIVLVNVGNIKRDRMGALLQSINNFHPRLTAIDVFFNHTDTTFATDSILKASLQAMKPLVMASRLPHRAYPKSTTEIKRSNPFYGAFNYGFVNFAIDDSFSVVREFSPYVVKDKDTLYSFASQVVRQIDEGAFQKMIRKKKKTEIINYEATENNFLTIEADSIIKGDAYIENAINNHIVLVGYISEDAAYPKLRDRFYTPLNSRIIGRSHPDAVGLVINANIILMMLKQNYISHLSWWITILLAFIICYLHIYFYIKILQRTHLWFHLITKGIQLLSAISILLIALFFYKQWGVKIDIGIILLSILISVDLLYFYEPIIKYCNKRFKIPSSFINL